MNGYRELLRQVWLDRQGYRGTARMSWVLLAAGLVLLVLCGMTDSNINLQLGLALAAFWGIPYIWCGSVLKTTLLQNRPEFSVLAPHLRARSVRLIAVLYLAITVLAGVAGGLVFGHPGYALLLGAAINVHMLFLQRYALLAFLPPAVILGCSQVGDWQGISQRLLRLSEPAVTLAGLALLLLLGLWGLRLSLPRGGDAHWRWFERYQERQRMTRDQPTQQGVVGAVWPTFWRLSYAASLARDSRRGASPVRMMMHALDAKASPLAHMGYAVLMAVIIFGAAFIYRAQGVPTVFYMTMPLMLLMGCQMYVLAAVDSVLRYRAEQSIFGLTARAPAKAQGSRVLLLGLLRGFGAVWLVSSLCAIAVDVLITGRLQVRGMTSLVIVVSAALGIMLLRDYAAMDAQHRERQAKAVTMTVLVAFTCANAVTPLWPQAPWHWISAALALVVVVVAVQRWRQLTMPSAARLVL